MSVVRTLTEPCDTVWSNHRNHGHFLTFTGDVFGLLAELMGRADGICGGMGGSQHLVADGFHSHGVQAGLTAIATGHALHHRLRAETGVAAVFLGDGTLGEGLLYESLNFASIWRLPVLFVIEHNGIAQTTPTSMTTGGSIPARGEAFGVRTWRIADTAPDLFEFVEESVRGVRRTGAPGFLVIETQRLGPHSRGDDTRDETELAALRARDPLERLRAALAPEEALRVDELNQAFLARVEAAAAASAPARLAVRRKQIFNRTADDVQTSGASGDVNVRQSLNGALARLLALDERVVLLGEDLHDPYGGAFKVTQGLSTSFPDRVISTPISEAALVGTGIGLALAGSRPIVEIMFADFLTLAMDQLVNHAVKFAGMFPDRPLPLVIRTPCGGRRGYGPTHSQSPEGLMAGIPGITVVTPSHRHDAGMLLERAVRAWSYPTIFFEPKALYGTSCDSRAYAVGAADPRDPAATLFPTLTKGPLEADVTLVTYGSMVPAVEAVAARLEDEELTVRVIVLSLIAPLPRHTLTALLLGPSSRIVAIEESHTAYGFGAELGAVLLEHGYRGQFLRIATPPVPIPAARSLESGIIPDDAFIWEQVSALCLV